LTMVTDTYLTAHERKQLSAAHNGIIAIIPEVKEVSDLVDGNNKSIDLTKTMEDLFVDYFRHKNKGQEPNEEIMKLFAEVLAEEEEQ